MKVLIADDDSVSRLLLQNYLQQWEYDVTVAEDGDKAWELFQQQPFPMVICDWMMPGMDGPDVIKRIRESSEPGSVYAILLTGKTKKGDFVSGIEAGADDFVTKPFDHDELRVRLRAGERIIRLEQSLKEAQDKLRDAGAS